MSTPPSVELEALQRRIATRAEEVRALRLESLRVRLPTVPLADLLLWGLVPANADPLLGVLRTVQRDLEVLAACVGTDHDTLEAAIVAAARRLDVAVELLRRLHAADRPVTSGDLLTENTDP